MTTLHAHHSHSSYSEITIEHVSISAPLRWLSAGFRDFKVAPANSILYGFVFAAIGMFILLMSTQYPAFTVAAISGFLLIGPFVAIGLYDMSAQIENSKKPSLSHASRHLHFNAISLISFAFIVSFIFAFWSRFTAVLTSVLFNNIDLATEGWMSLFSSESTSMLLTTFALTGLGLAVLVFSISVVAVPMMTHKKVDVITAIITSLRAMKSNFLPLLFWAAIIVGMIGVGIATFYVGLIITLPIIGHASWHAYRELVDLK